MKCSTVTTSHLFSKFAISMFNVDNVLPEFRECFQKMGNKLDTCRLRCQICEKFLKFPKPNTILLGIFQFISSIPSLLLCHGCLFRRDAQSFRLKTLAQPSARQTVGSFFAFRAHLLEGILAKRPRLLGHNNSDAEIISPRWLAEEAKKARERMKASYHGFARFSNVRFFVEFQFTGVQRHIGNSEFQCRQCDVHY